MQDHVSQNDSIADTIKELSGILNTSPVSVRAVQLSILYSVLSFFRGNSQIKKDKEVSYLEILDEMIHQIVRYDSVLQVTCQRKLTKLDEKKIEETQEDVFCEFANLLPYLKDLYKNK